MVGSGDQGQQRGGKLSVCHLANDNDLTMFPPWSRVYSRSTTDSDFSLMMSPATRASRGSLSAILTGSNMCLLSRKI
jgi:hypothetical protein